jgi:hypothetical protein
MLLLQRFLCSLEVTCHHFALVPQGAWRLITVYGRYAFSVRIAHNTSAKFMLRVILKVCTPTFKVQDNIQGQKKALLKIKPPQTKTFCVYFTMEITGTKVNFYCIKINIAVMISTVTRTNKCSTSLITALWPKQH